MDKFYITVGSSLVVFCTIFVACIFGTAFGCLAGWIVGLVFTSPVYVLDQMGVHNVYMYQFGGFMGFIGGFLRSQLSK